MIDFENGETKEIKWIAGSYKRPVRITRKDNRLWFQFQYNTIITADIKSSFTKYKWHGYDERPIKQWSVEYCQHNLFRIAYHAGLNPYAVYDSELIECQINRSMMEHQYDMTKHILTRHYAIIAGEMGLGKTLAIITALEEAGVEDILWVGPKSANYSVQLEFKKWKSKLNPRYITYSGLKRYIEEWPAGKKIHQAIIFDESHKLKNITSQRSQAAFYIAEHVRKEWGPNGYIVLMTGTPAPKSPIDWYSQCEIACPGFLKEGDIHKFKDRLGLVEERENIVTGGVYPHLVTWLDDERKCKTCGEYEDSYRHDLLNNPSCHPYESSKNEVGYLYERMKGLVLVKFKKDCLDLPEMNYRIIRCKVPRDLENAAKLILKTSTSAAKALILLRELSDGFQYKQTPDGTEVCPACNGTKTLPLPSYIGPDITPEQIFEYRQTNHLGSDEPEVPAEKFYPIEQFPQYYKIEQQACPNCKGLGEVTKYIRTLAEVKCPKDQVLRDILDEHDDVGRLVIYAGFTGSIDRCVNIVKSMEWTPIRVDGRGWWSPFDKNPEDLLDIFQNKIKEYPRVAFIGHPGSAGVGLTLTASPSEFYFSNDFSADSRIQSEARIHRPGMDINRGATIIDCFNLPSDEYVLKNLQAKKDLQSMSLGQLTKAFEEVQTDYYE